MSKKKIIGMIMVIVVLVISVCLFIIFPVSLTISTIICEHNGLEAYFLEDEDYTLNLEAFNGEAPSKLDTDYRYLKLDLDMKYTSPALMNSMVIYVDKIDTENKKYVITKGEGSFCEGENNSERFFKKGIAGLFMIVYIGDLENERQIKERMLDIAHNTTIKVLYNMQWFGNREYTWKCKSNFNKYMIWDDENGEEVKVDE